MGGQGDRRKSVLGNNAADGCHFCDYASTISSFQEIVFLRVMQEEDVSHVPGYTERKSLVRCYSEWLLNGDNISLMEERGTLRKSGGMRSSSAI